MTTSSTQGDIYQLGHVIWEVACAGVAYAGQSLQSILKSRRLGATLPTDSLDDDVAGLIRICMDDNPSMGGWVGREDIN